MNNNVPTPNNSKSLHGVHLQHLAELEEWGKLGMQFARDFRGQEQQLNDVVAACTEVDATVKRQLGIPEDSPLVLTREREMKATLRANGIDLPLTDDILEVASQTFRQCLTALGDTNNKRALEKMGITVISLKGVILQPDRAKKNEPNGNSSRPFNEFKTIPRLSKVLSLLQGERIFMDDIIVAQGEVHPGQMRHLSYYLVEIPRLNRQMLICDEVGEQTFVINGIMNRQALLQLTKTELQEKFANMVLPVPYHSENQYLSDISMALFYDMNNLDVKNPIGAKVKVFDQELLRDEILTQYPTSTAFFEAVLGNARRDVDILGKKMTAIMGRFGISGTDNKACVILSQKIYGADDSEVQKHMASIENGEDKEKWRASVKKVYPKMADFIALDSVGRNAMSINEMKMPGLMSIFFEGVGYDRRTKLNLYQLALEIYGNDDPETKAKVEAYIKKEESFMELAKDKNKLIGEIKKQFPTIEQFVEKCASYLDRLKIEIDGKKMHTIARIFGVKDISIKVGLYQLAKAVYGSEENPELQEEMNTYIKNEEMRKALGSDVEKWRSAIKAKYPTMEDFIRTGNESVIGRFGAIEVAGVKLMGIGKVFGHTKVESHTELRQLAGEIYNSEGEVF
ncbi:MAG: hypothetical protein NTX63_01510 [Candidatus Peregrinibacteria bacterium]|nr:hypothetical protein [Candidatus Peregrinibacteria bacterium]